MDKKIIGIKLLNGCSTTDDEESLRIFKEWFCKHGRWVFTCQDDTIQKLLGVTSPNNSEDMQQIVEYSGKPYGLVNGVIDCKPRLACWLQEQGRMTRIAIFEDSFDAAWVSLCAKHSEFPSQDSESTMFAVRIDPLFRFSGTSLEEFQKDQEQCYRKSIEHGEKILDTLIDTNLNGNAKGKIIVFPERVHLNKLPQWFMVSCENKSVGDCLAEALSYNLSELKGIAMSDSFCVSDLMTDGHNWEAVRAVKIFVRLESLMKFNRGDLCHAS